MTTSLLDDLAKARRETDINAGCPLCSYIRETEDEPTKRLLTEAAAGSIGRDKLVAILRAHETGMGRRTVERHRREEHTP